MTTTEIEALKVRVDGLEKQNEKQFTKIENSLDKVWAKIDEQKTGQTITHTLVEGLSKSFIDSRIDNAKVLEKITDKLDGLKEDMTRADIQRVLIESTQNEKRLISEGQLNEKLLTSENTSNDKLNSSNEKHNKKWENMYVKVITTIIGVLITILLVKLGFK